MPAYIQELRALKNQDSLSQDIKAITARYTTSRATGTLNSKLYEFIANSIKIDGFK